MIERPIHLCGREPMLTAEKVQWLRRMHELRKKVPTRVEVCRQLGITPDNYDHIVNRRTYKWVP